MQTYQPEAYTTNISLIGLTQDSYTPGQHSPTLISPRPPQEELGTRQPRTVSTLQNLMKFIRAANAKAALPIASHRTLVQALAVFSSHCLPPDQPWCFPLWPYMV